MPQRRSSRWRIPPSPAPAHPPTRSKRRGAEEVLPCRVWGTRTTHDKGGGGGVGARGREGGGKRDEAAAPR
ncbi:hypothetical protein EE612_024316 [Oryza sativa]|nr:hypothetical protein EE612_024316 [Oryza sativa]